MSESIVITGASRGLGRGLTETLVKRGLRVFATGRQFEDLTPLAQKLASEPGEIIPVEMDVAYDDSVTSARDRIAQITDHVDCLVNNAGVILEAGTGLSDLPADVLAETINTNAIGALRTTQAFRALLAKSDNSRIVNVSSGMGVMTDMGPGTTAYRASKAAMNVISLQSHFALTSDGIRVMSVCPGWVRTDMGGASATRSIAEGIEGILTAIATAPHGPSGLFFRDGKPISW